MAIDQGFYVGLDGIEPSTSALSVLRSNRLSYSPVTVDCRRETQDYTSASVLLGVDDAHLDPAHDVGDQVV
jgi:hypothetical protein